MKRTSAFVAAAVVALSLAACGSSDNRAERHPNPSGTKVTVAPRTSPPPIPRLPRTTVAELPEVYLYCSDPASGPWSWFDETFDYEAIPGSAPIAHYAIAYGDGATFEADTPDQVFDHRYTSPGVFPASVVVTDAAGLTGTSGCNVEWHTTLDGSGGEGPGDQPQGCSPLSPAGNCYERGQFCPDSLHNTTIQGGHGLITCRYVNGIWRFV